MAKKKILTDNGQEILPITHESCVLDNNGVSIGSKIGNINELATDSRTDLVSAINDILEFNNETKQQLIDILTSKGVDCSNDKTFNEILGILASKEFDLSEIKQIACGHSHMIILKTDGSIWGCGDNEYGELGLNDYEDRKVFTKITENINNDVAQVYCGFSYSFIVKNDGTVWSCGGGSHGELGNDDYTRDVSIFTQINVDLTSPVKQIACGHLHTMLLTEDGKLYTCGYALNGRLGLGINDESKHPTFTQVTTNINNDVKQVVCTQIASFILKNDGTVWACGKNEKGCLGLGDTNDRNTFTQINGITDVKQISCGYSHTVVLKNDGTVWACGNNNYGQLGIGIANDNNNTNFVQVNEGVKQIACGYSHTFVIKNDNALWGCGWNDVGQLGLGHKTNIASFTKNEFITGPIKMISCGRKYSAMILNDNQLYVTGDNNKGQLGLGTIIDIYNITRVFTKQNEINALNQIIDSKILSMSDVKQISCGLEFSYVLKNDGSLYSCGYNNYGQLGLNNSTNKGEFTQVTTNINNDVKQVICGMYHVFIIKNDDSLWACGWNGNGQLGLGNTNTKYVFTQVTTNVNDIKQIDCGFYHTFIVKKDGSLWGCGYNNNGELGLGNTTQKSTFTQVTTNINNDVKEVFCGKGSSSNTFIIKNDGSLWACGDNGYGQLGLGNNTTYRTFTQVTTNINNDVKQVDCAGIHTFILKNDGTVWSCGYNAAGQLGLGNTTSRNTFTQVTTNIDNIKTVICTGNYSVILKNNGSLWACGYNYTGQLGIGTSDDNAHTTFNQVTTNINNDVKQVDCGLNHVFILKNNGSLWSCGGDSYGQLGASNIGNKSNFVPVTNGFSY